MKSFGDAARVAVIGASGAIGGAFVARLAAAPQVACVYALSRRRPETLPAGVEWLPLDLEDEASIQDAAGAINAAGELDLALVATGVLHDSDGFQPEKAWRQIEPAGMARAFAINATGPMLVAKHFLALLPRDRRGGFAAISARVGSIEDNRLGGWYAYRAAKAALNQLLRTASIELARRHKFAFCVGLHPGTVDSGLSEPFQGQVPEGKLFTPAYSAERLLAVVDDLDAGDSGGLFAWDGARIPF